MMKFIKTLILALALVLPTFASDSSLFNANELSVSLGTSYTVDYHVTSVKDAFAQPYDFNLNVGAQYFLTRNLGVEANLPFYQTKGVSFSEVQAGLVFRLPLSSSTPILKSIAPYVGVGGVYNWVEDQSWAYVGKAGVEFRLNKKWGVFSEAQYRNTDFKWGNGATSIAGGLRLVF
jgi:outer membrane protein W